MKHRVYIAAASECAGQARRVGEELQRRCSDVEVVSRWHRAVVPKYPAELQERAEAVAMNVSDILRATTFLLLTHEGVPRSAWVELGIAIASNIHVIWIEGPAPEQKSIFDAHANVEVVRGCGIEKVEPETIAYLVAKMLQEAA